MTVVKDRLFNGVLWSFFGQFFAMFILFFANILLAKKLSPFEFGQVGVVMFFINIFNVLIESGLGGAIVRKPDASKEDYDTVFAFNLSISIFLYIILFLSSGLISSYYNDATLNTIIKVSGLILIINGFQLIHNTKMIKEMRFKRLAICRIYSISIASIVAILSAYYFQFGVWAIIVMQILNVFINTIFLNLSNVYVNKFRFIKSSFKELYKFGVNTTLSSILNTIFDNIYNIVLGKFFGMNSGGYYYQAKKIQDIPTNIINSLNQGAIFSSLSKNQLHAQVFNSLYKRVFTILVVGVSFMSLGIFLFSQDIVRIVLNEKWIQSIFYIKFLTAVSFFYLLEQYNRVLYKIFNLTGLILKLEIIKKVIQSISIILGIYFQSIQVLMFGLLITSIVSYLINYYVSRKRFEFISSMELILIFKVLLIVLIIVFFFDMIPNFHFIVRVVLYFIIFNLLGIIFRTHNLYKTLKERKFDV